MNLETWYRIRRQVNQSPAALLIWIFLFYGYISRMRPVALSRVYPRLVARVNHIRRRRAEVCQYV